MFLEVLMRIMQSFGAQFSDCSIFFVDKYWPGFLLDVDILFYWIPTSKRVRRAGVTEIGSNTQRLALHSHALLATHCCCVVVLLRFTDTQRRIDCEAESCAEQLKIETRKKRSTRLIYTCSVTRRP